MLSSPGRRLVFDAFTLDPVRALLLRGDTELSLRRQSLEVLCYLAEHAGKVVSTDELIGALWRTKPADQTGSVGQCIKEIRRALGNDARWIIKTASGRGYVFVAEVMPLAPATPDPTFGQSQMLVAVPDEPSRTDDAKPPTSRSSRRTYGRATAPIAVACSIVLLAIFWALWQGRDVPAPRSAMTMMAAPTIAVLPFTHRSQNGLGLDAEIQSELARVHRGFDLIIMSAASNRGESSPAVAGTSPGARYVVAGTTWLDQGIERASIQLVDTEMDRQIWSEPFELSSERSGATSRVAARIARQLIVHVRTAESRRPLPETIEAGHYVLQGRALHETERNPQSTREAQSLFSKALKLDPDSISGLQGYATTKLIQVHNGWLPFEQKPAAMAEAEEAIERLIKLDPGNAAGHYLRGSLLRARGAPDKAIASLTYSLSLNSSFFAAHAELGRIKIDAGRALESIVHIREALELSPPETNMHVLYFWMGLAALHTADDEAAVQWFLKALQINPRFDAPHLYLAAAYLGVEDEAKARASMAEFRNHMPNVSIDGLKRVVPSPTQVAAHQRERMLDAWRRLGIPESDPAARDR